MDAQFFDDTVRAYKQRQPYHPFTVVLTSGTRLECDFPDSIIARGGQAVHLGPQNVPTIFDNQSVDHILGDLSDGEIAEARESRTA